MISKIQEQEIKKQLLEQIEDNFPQEKKAEAISQINSLEGEAFEQFLIQNNLIKSSSEAGNNKCVFCSIIDGEIPSTKIEETQKAVAVLELNPISHAHTIIIPKEHISKEEDLPDEIRFFAKKIAEKIKQKFKPKDIIFFNTNLFGHEIINVLPVYSNETKDSKRLKSSPEELKKIADELSRITEDKIIEKKTEEKKEEIKDEINEKNTWLPRRLP
jgi:diadenosine tetraphosphate (Ap4A) HIT family hydrolase